MLKDKNTLLLIISITEQNGVWSLAVIKVGTEYVKQ